MWSLGQGVTYLDGQDFGVVTCGHFPAHVIVVGIGSIGVITARSMMVMVVVRVGGRVQCKDVMCKDMYVCEGVYAHVYEGTYL